MARPPDERLVFINAWNEWAEGNHLEPCDRWGHGYLRATRDALTDAPGPGATP
jgi:lipopolysaccharide biosynthesis protein